jgi:hypothetical protein
VKRAILAALAASTLSLSAVSTAYEPEPEPIIFCEHAKAGCSQSEYGVIKSPRCEENRQNACFAHSRAPGVNEIICRAVDTGYECNVWSRGDLLTYSYVGSSNLEISPSGPTSSSTFWVNCRDSGFGGWATVTVTSPFGLSSSDSVSISCGNPWH